MLKEKIKGDKFLLDIAVSNLIGNSIKYGIDGGNVEVTINSDSKNLYIEVCDDGVGIPEEELPKIFNDFFAFLTFEETQKVINNFRKGTAITYEKYLKKIDSFKISMKKYKNRICSRYTLFLLFKV